MFSKIYLIELNTTKEFLDMDKCTTEYCYSNDEWQNSLIMMGYHIKRKLEAVENGSVTIQQSPPNPLTNEALYMIFVILAFVVLAAVGTLLTIYDYFCKECKEKNYSNGILKKKDAAQNGYHVEDQQISFDTPSDSGWLSTSKSFFNCFCVITNGKKIFQISSSEDPLYCLHGIRLFSTVCIIISHCIGFYVYISNGVSSKGFFCNWYSQYLLAVHNAITAFFVLGGFLNAISFFHYYEKTKGNIPYLLFYLNRFR
ncbi:nose resistant to fluoxetine protein 6, partial [Nephila pilipes]